MCSYCGAYNGTVKKSGTLKISHEPFRAPRTAEAKAEWVGTFSNAVADDPTVAKYLEKAVEDLNPLKVLELFKRVTAEVSRLSTNTDARTANYYPSIPKSVGQRTTSGNTFPFPRLVSVHPLHPKQATTKTT